MSAAADQQVEWRRPDIAIIEHSLMHEGRPVDRVTKTVLRNDIVAKADAPV